MSQSVGYNPNHNGKITSIMGRFKYFYHYKYNMEKAVTVMDKQGRIYIPKNLKKDLGRKFFVVKIDKEIMLVPIPIDPAKELERIGKRLPKKSIRELRKGILEAAMNVV